MTRAALTAILACAPLLAETPAFVKIPAGSFVMGCEPANTCPERQTPRKVTFARDFWMQKTEVTVSAFREFVRKTGYKTVAEETGQLWTWSRPRAFKLDGRQPVVYVTLRDAEAYCSSIGARVPTEPEWTYAFRAGESIRGHLWWDTDGRYVWHRENSGSRPRAVGTKLPNAWGLFDMEGNVWEWTRTVAPDKYSAAIRGGSWVTCPFVEVEPWAKGEQPRPRFDGPFSRCPSDGAVHIRDDVGFRCARPEP